MTKYKKELVPLKNAASFLEEDDDDLIKDIEDHAQACIDEVIKLKEEFKADVRRTIKQRKQVKQDVSAALNEVTERIEKIQEPLAKATKLVLEQQYGLEHLKQLTSIKQELEVNATRCDQNSREKFHDLIFKLLHQKHTFFEGELPILGELEESTIQEDEFEPTFIHEHTITADSKDKFVPCVANLGKQYAVAHPTTKGKPSNAIDIYEISGTLKFTLQENVGPVHDMSSTPENKLAVLTEGNDGVSQCSVKVYDTDTGKLCSNTNLQLKGSIAISLGVNFQNQYVILGQTYKRKKRQKTIAIFNEDGSVEHEHTITGEAKFYNLSRVTCGFKYIYVMGEKAVVVYEVKELGLVQKSIIGENIDLALDISASVLDHLFLVDYPGFNIYLQRFFDYEANNKSDMTKSDWKNEYTDVKTNVSQIGTQWAQCRISVKGHPPTAGLFASLLFIRSDKVCLSV